MKVLVTGATGFIGRELLLKLNAQGHQLVVLSRNPKTARVRLPVHCEVHQWDPALLEPPEAALAGVDAVVNLAGESIVGRWTESRKKEIERSRLLSTHHLVKALSRMDRPPKVLVSASGIGIYGDGKDLEVDEMAMRGGGFLADLCDKWEAEANKAKDAGMRVVNLRIGVVLGNDGGALHLMLPAFRAGLGGPLGGGRQWMSWIHVADLAGLIAHAINTDSLEGPVNAVAPNPQTNKQFSKTLGRVLKRPVFLSVPGVVIRSLAGEMSQVLLASTRATAKQALDSGYEFLYEELKPALTSICCRKGFELQMEQWVPQPIEKVFSFFSEARNLETITPSHLGFRIVHMSTDKIESATRLTYRLQVHGVPFTWQSMILDWDPPRRFTDIQVEGPYQFWAHTHDFIEKDGGTLIRDHVYYRVPLWLLGEVILHPFIRRDLESIFQYRWEKVAEIFKS